MVKSISVMWSESITEHESQVLVSTLEHTLRRLFMQHPVAYTDPPIQMRVFGTWVIPDIAPNEPYWGTQWYIQNSYDEGLQRLIAPVFLELVRLEPWQRSEPHFDLALVDQDITDFPAPLARLRPQHYSLGSSFPGTGAVLSVYRLRRLADESVRDLALARLVRHHLGHTLGVPELTRKQNVLRLGLELHCTNVCTMRHAGSVEELVELTLEETEMGWPFCQACTQSLHSVVIRHALSWN